MDIFSLYTSPLLLSSSSYVTHKMLQTKPSRFFSLFFLFLYVPLFSSLYRLMVTNKHRKKAGKLNTKSTHTHTTRLSPRTSACCIYSTFASFSSISFFFFYSNKLTIKTHMERDTLRPPPPSHYSHPSHHKVPPFPLFLTTHLVPCLHPRRINKHTQISSKFKQEKGEKTRSARLRQRQAPSQSLTTTQAQHQVEGGLLLDVVVRESAPVLQLLPREDEALLVGRDALLVLNLLLHVLDRVARLHVQRDGLALLVDWCEGRARGREDHKSFCFTRPFFTQPDLSAHTPHPRTPTRAHKHVPSAS